MNELVCCYVIQQFRIQKLTHVIEIGRRKSVENRLNIISKKIRPMSVFRRVFFFTNKKSKIKRICSKK